MFRAYFFVVIHLYFTLNSFAIAQNKIVELSNYSYPLPSKSANIERVAIIATNDIHGHILPTTTFFPNSSKTLRSGGVLLMSTYINALVKEWQENLLWLDSGDQYQGTIESNSYVGEPIVKFFNFMNFTNRMAAAVGNHDFDFGFENQSKVFKQADYPYLTANVYNASTNSYWNMDNVKKSEIFSVGSLKIGVVGLTTKSTPFTTAYNVSSLDFKSYGRITIDESQKLRDQGADIVLLACHIGMFCTKGSRYELASLLLRNRSTPQEDTCNPADELNSFIRQLPKGVIDAVLGGHTHTIVHHWVNEIPILIGDMYARHFNVLYLEYDKINKRLVSENTQIEGPIPVCENLYPEERTCYDDNTKSGEFIFKEDMEFPNVSFHGQIIGIDQNLKSYLSPYLEKVSEFTDEKIAYIARPMEVTKKKESSLGNFVSDAMQSVTNADFVILNRGVVRRNWDEGVLTYDVLFATIPIDNYVVTFEMTGKEFVETMKIIQRGGMGYYSTSGVKQIICSDKRFLIDIRFRNESEIDLDRTYTIATTNFMIYGGDDFHQVIKKYTPKNIKDFPILRDILFNYAKEKQILNSYESPCIDELNPRLILIPTCQNLDLNNAHKDFLSTKK